MKRREVLFAVIGGMVGAVLVMAAGSFSPLGAQNEVRDAEFGNIRCRNIVVADSEGNTNVAIFADEHGGNVSVVSNDTKSGISRLRASMLATENGAEVIMYSGGVVGSMVTMKTDGDNGSVNVVGRDSQAVSISADDYGVSVRTDGKHGIYGTSMVCTEKGGLVAVFDGDGKVRASMSTEHSGQVGVHGNGGKFGAVMHINDYGDGVVSTWDKNGNPLK